MYAQGKLQLGVGPIQDLAIGMMDAFVMECVSDQVCNQSMRMDAHAAPWWLCAQIAFGRTSHLTRYRPARPNLGPAVSSCPAILSREMSCQTEDLNGETCLLNEELLAKVVKWCIEDSAHPSEIS